MKPIIVGVDQSIANLRACDYASELAIATGAKLLLAQIIEPIPNVVPENAILAIAETAEEQLSMRAQQLRTYANDLDVEYVVGRGDPWEGLSKLALERDAELVVVGTFGRRGVSRALLGSVAEKVVRTSPRPVVTVPAHAFTNRSQAGRRLGAILAERQLHAPSVVAVSRGAIPVALEVARALAAPLDLWLTEPIIGHARELGALGEDGHASFVGTAFEVDEPERTLAENEAFGRLTRELKRLRGTLPPGEVWKRTAIVVSDGIGSPAAVAAAAGAMRSLGAERTIVAAPVVGRRALDALGEHCDEIVYVEAAIVADVPDCWYRHATLPTARAARIAISAYAPGTVAANAS